MKRRKTEFDDWREALLAEVFHHAEDLWGWNRCQLAGEAGLAPSTVHNLYWRVTKEPRLHTIYKLARAIGMTMKMVEAVKRRKVA